MWENLRAQILKSTVPKVWAQDPDQHKIQTSTISPVFILFDAFLRMSLCEAHRFTRVLVLSPPADRQEEAGIREEQAVPQEGQETDQEISIESPPPTSRHIVEGREGNKL